ncbi:MAG TPA: GNAT family N-acetyltransferase [Kofleriaceae bacterium]
MDLLDEVIVAPRRTFSVLSDTRVIERGGWLQIITPSSKLVSLNQVIYSALANDEADEAIGEAVAMYRELGLRFRWNAGPGSAPADLGARLERHGLVASWGRGMVRRIASAPVASDDRVVEVEARTIDDFTAVVAAGWGADAAPLDAIHRQQLAEGRTGLFVAYDDGMPAAAAAYHACSRSAFFIGGVVLPAHRGRGLYRALVETRIAHVQRRGFALATTHARESTSAPILERLGFTTVCRFPMYFG